MSEELVRGGYQSIDPSIEETVNPTISIMSVNSLKKLVVHERYLGHSDRETREK